MGPGVFLGLALALLCAAPVGPAGPVSGDFNQDQRLDQEDLGLLRAALGGADPLYDLNGDGRVDLEDFFRWADQVEIAPAAGPAPDSAAVISPAPLGEGTAVPDTALPLQSVLPADTTALAPSALPDSSALLPALPDSPLTAVLPADTTALAPAAPADSTALLPDPTPSVPPATSDSTMLPPAAPPLDSAVFIPPLDGELVLPDTALPLQPVPPAYYAIAATRQTTTVWLTGYTIVLHNTKPFGIASLRLKGQPVDFVHPDLPLGDWEWFWFAEPGQPQGRAAIKLLEAEWAPPQVERGAAEVVIRFRRSDTLRQGVELEVAYHLDARRAEFTVEYNIGNHSGRFLSKPYMMVGFPGFTNQQWVEEVSTAEKVRRPLRPFANFLAEAQAHQLTDYLLLRQDWDPQTQAPEALKGSVVLHGTDRSYTLTTTLAAAPGLSGAYIAHTNKPRYLTSHLYAFLKSMGEGQNRSVAVHYVLSSGN